MPDPYDDYLREDFERAMEAPPLMECIELLWNGQEECEGWVDPDYYLSHCRRRWEEGYLPAAGYATLFCTHNQLPLPDWLASVVNRAMLFAFEKGGSPGKGKTGGYLKQARRLEKYVTQYEAVLRRFKLGADSVEEACHLASKDLRGTEARASPNQVRKNYYAVRKNYKALIGWHSPN